MPYSGNTYANIKFVSNAELLKLWKHCRFNNYLANSLFYKFNQLIDIKDQDNFDIWINITWFRYNDCYTIPNNTLRHCFIWINT